MTDGWVVTTTIRRKLRADKLIEMDDSLSDGSVGAIPMLGQFRVSVFVDAIDYDKATRLGLDETLAMLQRFDVAPEVVSVETVDEDEFARRANEPTLPELVSAPEVGKMLGVSRQRVHQLRAENRHFPGEIMHLGSGPIWIADSIRKFQKEWDRKPGRPKSEAS